MSFNNSTNNLFRSQKIINSAVTYVVLDDDVIINITDTTAPRAVTLPAPGATNIGKFFVVKDTSGGASSNNITVAGISGNIDGTANHIINSDYGSAVFYSDGTNYFTQSEISVAEGVLNVSTVTADPAPAVVGTMYLVNTSAGPITITLPTAVGVSGKSIVIQKNTSDTNIVIVQTTSSQTINGNAPPLNLLGKGDAVTFTSDNANWQIQSDNRSNIISSPSYIQVGVNQQTTNLAVNDPIRYDTTIDSTGTDITYNPTTFTFNVKAGNTYKMSASIARADGSAAHRFELTYQWFDVTGSANIGGSGSIGIPYDQGNAAGTAAAIFTPTVDSDIQVRILKNVAVNILNSNEGTNGIHAEIEVISKQPSVAEGVLNVSTVTADPAPAVVGTMYLVNTSAGPITITLPTAVGVSGKSIVIQKNTSDTNIVIVQTTSSQTINGNAPPLNLLGKGDAVTFTSDNANWQIQSDNRSNIISSPSYIQVGVNQQTTNLAVNSPIRYDTTIDSTGTDITYNPTTFTFNIQAGNTYKMSASVARADGSVPHAFEFTYQWFDVTEAAYIGGAGSTGIPYDQSNAAGTAAAIFTPTVNSDIQVRIVKNIAVNILNSNNGTNGIHAEIEVMSKQVASKEIASGIDGSVQFSENGILASNNSNLFWDNTNNRLGVGTILPRGPLDIPGFIAMDSSSVALISTPRPISALGSVGIYFVNARLSNNDYFNFTCFIGLNSGATLYLVLGGCSDALASSNNQQGNLINISITADRFTTATIKSTNERIVISVNNGTGMLEMERVGATPSAAIEFKTIRFAGNF